MYIKIKFTNILKRAGQRHAQTLFFVQDRQDGFTMIEVLIALAVFTIGIVGGLTLALANYNTDKENFNRVAGANLAREGIELVKNIRDSNWLRVEDNADCFGDPCTWSYGLADYNYIYLDYNDDIVSAGIHTCDCSTDDLSYCIEFVCNSQLYLDSNGYYNHDDPVTATRFERLIKLQAICLSGVGAQSISGDNSCNAGDTLIGFKVTARVNWPQGSGIGHVEVADYLYNWR